MAPYHATRYVVFGGSGFKAVSYIGLLKALQTHDPLYTTWHSNLRGACATSSGCIAALAFIVGADANVILQRWSSIDAGTAVGSLSLNVASTFGIDSDGIVVKRIISEVFSACGIAHDTTFATLYRLVPKELRICATNLNKMCIQVFSHVRTPHVRVCDAFFYSMTVPFVYSPETFDGDLMVDGCCLAPVPLQDDWVDEAFVIFASQQSTTDERVEVSGLGQYAHRVMACCHKTMLCKAREHIVQSPHTTVHISVDSKYDAFLEIDEERFEVLSWTGFVAGVLRIWPKLAYTMYVLVVYVATCTADQTPPPLVMEQN